MSQLPEVPQYIIGAKHAEALFKRSLEAYFKDPSDSNLFGVTLKCLRLQRTYGDGAEDVYNKLVGWYFDHWPPEKTQPVYDWKEQLGLYQKWLNGEFKI